MSQIQKVLIIIPARGGSKGIPRKNLRLLNNKPLIYYSIRNAMCSIYKPDVYVSTEDDEIAGLALKIGASVHIRPQNLSDDKSTLDPVIFNTVVEIENKTGTKYELVITLQPTSPLLKSRTIDNAISKILNTPEIDTIISAQKDVHLTWIEVNGKFIPNYKERLNRQYLTPVYRETGGFLITRRRFISENNRIGSNVDLYVLNNGEEIDIDNLTDWNLCSYLLSKKKIVIVVAGNHEIGLGHVYNMLILAGGILEHDVEFVIAKGSHLAYEKIVSKNYRVKMQEKDKMEDEIIELAPDVVINDILDTAYDYIDNLKKNDITVINFEDLGEGAKRADLVINAIYPEDKVLLNHFFGPEYFLLRDEFILQNTNNISEKVKTVLISYGGVDPNNLTLRTLESIYEYCCSNNIQINVITGFGYDKHDTLSKFDRISILQNVVNISDYIFDSDVVFSSAGRTVYEIASLGTPAIILAQNQRELTHFFAYENYGFINLGLGINIEKDNLLKTFEDYIENIDLRRTNHLRMLKFNLKEGRKRVLNLISDTINKNSK